MTVIHSTSVEMGRLPDACPHCSTRTSTVFHSGPCPRVKAIEYHPNGTVKRVEFHESSDD